MSESNSGDQIAGNVESNLPENADRTDVPPRKNLGKQRAVLWNVYRVPGEDQ